MRARILFFLVGATAALAVLTSTATAQAAVRSGSETFNPNNPAPTFNQPQQLPLSTVTVVYDDTGSLTVTETGGAPSYFEGWPGASIKITGPNTSELDTEIGVNSGYDELTDSQVGGSLSPSVSKSADGSTNTYTWSSAMLANQNYSLVQISADEDGTDNSCFCDIGPLGSFYFTGYAPTITVTNPGLVSGSVGFPATFQVAATETGIADADANNINAPGITSYSATGLPPGLHINSAGEISGTPTQPGSYQTTVTVAGQYNEDKQTTSASATFTWVVSRPSAYVPVFLGAPYQGKGLAIRPSEITYTGDGTGFFAGYGKPSHSPHVGRIRWTQWTPTQATGTGGDWIDNCTPACANGLRTAYRVGLKLYDPAVIHGHNVFTRLTVTYRRIPYLHGHSTTLKLQYAYGGFTWQGF
jgi:hypothetical protein